MTGPKFSEICSFANCVCRFANRRVVTHNCVPHQLYTMRTSPDWRVARQTRLNHVKEALLRRIHAVSILLVPDRRPEALVSTLTLFYNLGHIGVIARQFSTKLADNVPTYFLCAQTNFHAQMPACRATVAQTVSPQKHCTLGAT